MGKGLDKLRSDPRVEHVDDERAMGNAIIVTLAEGWTLNPRDPHDGVFGADTLKECRDMLAKAVRIS